jgi:hypothetical protein
MIDINKKYKTRNGHHVKILSIDKDDCRSFSAVKGIIEEGDGRKLDCSWSLYGDYCAEFIESHNDLIEEQND